MSDIIHISIIIQWSLSAWYSTLYYIPTYNQCDIIYMLSHSSLWTRPTVMITAKKYLLGDPFHWSLFPHNSNSLEISYFSNAYLTTVMAEKFCKYHESCAVVVRWLEIIGLVQDSLLTHWSYVFLTLTDRNVIVIWNLTEKSLVTQAPRFICVGLWSNLKCGMVE